VGVDVGVAGTGVGKEVGVISQPVSKTSVIRIMSLFPFISISFLGERRLNLELLPRACASAVGRPKLVAPGQRPEDRPGRPRKLFAHPGRLHARVGQQARRKRRNPAARRFTSLSALPPQVSRVHRDSAAQGNVTTSPSGVVTEPVPCS
jgi:hypothetical protein